MRDCELRRPCPSCGGRHYVEDDVDIYCVDCGLVMWTNYSYVGGCKIVLSGYEEE